MCIYHLIHLRSKTSSVIEKEKLIIKETHLNQERNIPKIEKKLDNPTIESNFKDGESAARGQKPFKNQVILIWPLLLIKIHI